MAALWTVRKLDPDSEPTRPFKLKVTAFWALLRRVRKQSGRRRLRWAGKVHPPVDGGPFAVVTRVFQLLDQGQPNVSVIPDEGDSFLARKFSPPAPPTMQTPGTPGIDQIYTAVMSEFAGRFEVTNLGICNPKPGEHHYCNAVDFGVRPDLPAEVIHNQITQIWDYLRSEGVKNDAAPNQGLPVNGCIVMSQYWESGMGSQDERVYRGTPHVTHCHVSAKPSITGWI